MIIIVFISLNLGANILFRTHADTIYEADDMIKDKRPSNRPISNAIQASAKLEEKQTAKKDLEIIKKTAVLESGPGADQHLEEGISPILNKRRKSATPAKSAVVIGTRVSLEEEAEKPRPKSLTNEIDKRMSYEMDVNLSYFRKTEELVEEHEEEEDKQAKVSGSIASFKSSTRLSLSSASTLSKKDQ